MYTHQFYQSPAHRCKASSREEKSSKVWSRSSTSNRFPARGGLMRWTAVLAVNLFVYIVMG